MIKSRVSVSLVTPSLGSIQQKYQKKSIILTYPCNSTTLCTPYRLDLKPGSYKFECWGSKSSFWSDQKTQRSLPGLGAYTKGILNLTQPQVFYVHIGTTGLYNAVKEVNSIPGIAPGGATDVRLVSSTNWWDIKSLLSLSLYL